MSQKKNKRKLLSIETLQKFRKKRKLVSKDLNNAQDLQNDVSVRIDCADGCLVYKLSDFPKSCFFHEVHNGAHWKNEKDALVKKSENESTIVDPSEQVYTLAFCNKALFESVVQSFDDPLVFVQPEMARIYDFLQIPLPKDRSAPYFDTNELFALVEKKFLQEQLKAHSENCHQTVKTLQHIRNLLEKNQLQFLDNKTIKIKMDQMPNDWAFEEAYSINTGQSTRSYLAVSHVTKQ